MRTWLYNRLMALPNKPASIPTLSVISAAGADQPVHPFFLISMSVERVPLGMPASSGTKEIPFSISVHDRSASMLRIDEGCLWVQHELPTDTGFKVGLLSVYNIAYVETTGDSFDDHFKTNFRSVRFTMMTRR